MNPDPEPDLLGKGIRFGCGFVFGGVLAFFVALRELAQNLDFFWLIVGGAAVFAGIAAVRFGDSFWHAASRWFRWW
jgi:hypothetical protein